jgi:hypothetical protein
MVFNFLELKEKASRDIDRFIIALSSRNFVESLDYALNAAFSIYHLLEWNEKKSNPGSKKSSERIVKESNREDLKILHYIVTNIKHAECRQPFGYTGTNPKIVSPPFLCTEAGVPITAEDGVFITGEGEFNVYFGEHEAIKILRSAMGFFN